MKDKKKIIALLAVLVMSVQIFCPVFAKIDFEPTKEQESRKVDTKDTYGNFKYEIIGEEVTITGYVTEPEGELVIPETIKGYPVTTIGDYAFAYCESLTSVEMPKVQLISGRAFYECYSLTSIEMPKVQLIDGRAFSGCHSLTSIIISSDNENYSAEGGILYNKDKSTLVAYPSAANDIKIADNVQTIGYSAFAYCESLTSVEMPKVQTIYANAFDGCISLTGSVEMPEVQTIWDYAFYGCVSLTSVEMPKVQTIGDEVFSGCHSLTSIIISSDNENYSVEGGILYNKDKSTLIAYPSAANDIKIADSVQMIESWAFYNCVSLTSVEMPKVQTIGYGTFAYCKSLTSVEMSEVQMIIGSAFSGCHSLTSIIISSDNENYSAEGGILYNKDKSTLIAYPSAANDIEIADNVQTIGYGAFAYCKSLTSVKMFDVQTIGNLAFANCESLTSAYFYSDAPTSFGIRVFYECAQGFTIYYKNGTQGWSIPTWNGYPAYPFNAETGDVNGDGKINTADAVVILKYAAEMIQLDGIQSSAADVNHDGKVNTADAVLILKYAAGMITEF